MKTFNLILLTIAASMLFSCASIVNSINKSKFNQAVKVEITNYEEINIEDNFSVAAGGLNVNMGNLPSVFATIGLGVDLQHHNSAFGTVVFDYNYPFHFTSAAGRTYFPSIKAVPLHEFNLNYSYPIFKYISNQERYIAAVDKITEQNYVVRTETAVLNKFDLRLGLLSDYNKTYSSGYKSIINENFSTFNFIDNKKDLSEINQNSKLLTIGIGYKNYINTSLDATTKKGQLINAYSSIISNYYFDFSILLANSAERIDYSYLTSNNFEPSVLHVDNVHPSDFLKQKSYGFTLGYQVIVSSILKPKLSNIYTFEIGTIPGYYNKTINAFNFRLGIKYGIGKWH